MLPTLTRESHWVCPNCELTDVTFDPRPHSRFHNCRGMRAMSVPMVPDGVNCKVELVERQDFTNGDLVRTDIEGKVWQSVVTTRDEGQDCAVYAPCATAEEI